MIHNEKKSVKDESVNSKNDTDRKYTINGNFYENVQNIENSMGHAENIHINKGHGKTISPRNSFRLSIGTLIEDGMIEHKQDFAIIFQLEMEMNYLAIDTYANMIKLIETVVNIPTELIPTINSFKGLAENNQPYPDWHFTGLPLGTISRRKSIANAYIREMASYGYMHPSLKE